MRSGGQVPPSGGPHGVGQAQQSDRRAPWLLQWFAVAVLVLSTGAFFALADPLPGGQSRPVVLGLWVVAYVVAVVGLLDDAYRSRRRVSLPLALLLFLAVAFASAFWSEAPVLTLRRAIGLLGTVLVGALLAQRLKALDLLDAVRRAMLVLAVCSLVLRLTNDPAGLDPDHGTLRGVVATKNSLGFFMALGLLSCVVIALMDRGRVRRCAVSAAVLAVTLLLTDSKSGLIIALAVVLYGGCVLLQRTTAGSLLIAAVVCILAAAATLLLPYATLETGAALIGEDTTLTGRDLVWAESVEAARARPWFGHGYGAFWASSDAAQGIKSRLFWDVPHAHNGVLEVLLDLGLVGVLLACGVVVGLVVRGVSELRAGRFEQAAVRLPIGGLIVFANLVESNLLQQNTLLTVLFASALAMSGSRRAATNVERGPVPPPPLREALTARRPWRRSP